MAIAFGAAAQNSAKAASSLTITITISANDTVVVVVGILGTSTVVSVTDTGGSVYNQRSAVANGATNRVEVWSTAAGAAIASTSVTITISAAGAAEYVVARYTGVQALGNTGTATGSSTAPAVTVTTQDANNWVASGFTNNGTSTYTATTPNVVRASGGTTGGSAASNERGAEGDAGAFVAAGASTVTVTLSASNVWAAAGLELRSVAPALTPLEWDESQRWQLNADTHVSWGTGEEDTGLQPIIPKIVYDDEQSHWIDTQYQQDDEPWHTFFLIPVAPPTLGWDDWDWSNSYPWNYSPQTTEEDFGLLPVIPVLAWDDWDWSKDYSTAHAMPPEAEPFDFTLPIVPSFGWFDDPLQSYAQAGLSGLVVLDEFVKAPLIVSSGPAPLGRSIRWGFSISAFR